ncbi:temperature dependent protein affecting M2 dsRNA replication-domain-containing protein, partial [Lobosporangium transversale]
MPVRHLDFYLTQKNLASTHPLTTLKDIRLGIDGSVWLKKVIGAASEQYLPGIGGIPSCLRKTIEKELEGFKAASIHPLFVFPGLSLIRKDKPHVNDDLKIPKRNTAWEAANAGKMELALSSWSGSYVVHQPDLYHLVIRILKEHNIDYLRAPYGAGAQLVYLERNPKQIIHAIYAGPDLLMFDVERVITQIDFGKQTYQAISKKSVLQDMVLTDEQFLDLCILAGVDHCPTFPPFSVEGGFAYKSIHELLQHRTGFNAVKAYADSPQVVKSNYVDLFCRMRCAMRHHPILTDEGHVEPMNVIQAPNDIHEFIGFRLPDEVYYYISRGLIADTTLNTLLCGYGVEFSPLCNGEAKEYRAFLAGDIIKMKAQTMALVKSQLHSFFHDRRIAIIHWYENNNVTGTEHVVKSEAAPVPVEAISNWKSSQQSVEKELKKANITTPNFSFALGLLTNPNDAAATVQPKDANGKSAPLMTLQEVQTRHLSKLLQLRSFIDSSHTPLPYGKAIIDAFKAHPSAPVEFQDALFIALELIRAELLTARPYSHSYVKKAVLDDETGTKAVRLISRTVSLIWARFKGTKIWSGPLNRELLAFNSVNKVLTRNLRHLGEALIVEMLLANECQKDTLDFSELATHLPFAYEPSTVLGILVKEYLETLTLSGDINNKDQALQHVEEHIGATSTSSLANSIKEEIQRGFAFWEVVVSAVKSLSATNAISRELQQEFQDANNWIKSRK